MWGFQETDTKPMEITDPSISPRVCPWTVPPIPSFPIIIFPFFGQSWTLVANTLPFLSHSRLFTPGSGTDSGARPPSFVSAPFLASPSAYALPTFGFSGTHAGGIG